MADEAGSRPRVHRGLADVCFDRTRITSIDGRAGRLAHRGISIDELAAHAGFEETAWLLWHGELPRRAELEAFDASLRAARAVPPPVVEVLRGQADARPMDALRTGLSALAAFDPDRGDESREALLRKGTRLLAQVATLVAAHHALRSGREPTPPDPALPHAANLLAMLTGKPPGERAARVLDTDLVLHADHGANASTFAARVVAGTRADLHAAVTAAVAAFSGPLHGGAVEGVMAMLEEIGDPERLDDWLAARRARRQPVMGFGHRVYRTEDPRARHLRRLVHELSEETGERTGAEILERLVRAMRPYARHGVDVNVDLYAGVLYRLLRIPRDLAVPLFVAGRMAGWVAQVLEQHERNILIRPRLAYAGPAPRPWVPLEGREPERRDRIYHLAPLSELRRGLGAERYAPDRLPEDGFVHCSGSPETTLAVARDVFGGVSEPLVCLELAAERLRAPVRWEAPAPLPGAGTGHLATAGRFPHVHGPLDRAAVCGAGLLRRAGDGWAWPERFVPLEALLDGLAASRSADGDA